MENFNSLLELFRITEEAGHRFFAVDEDNKVYSFNSRPEYNTIFRSWQPVQENTYMVVCKRIGLFELKCDPSMSLIDVTKITL